MKSAELSVQSSSRHKRPATNFARQLVSRMGHNTCLVDAASGLRYDHGEVPDRIAGFAAGFLASGLHPGDRILISCGLTPLSALAYLGAMYAGLVAVPVEDRTLSSLGQDLGSRVRAAAIWTPRQQPVDREARHGLAQLAGEFPPRPVTSMDAAPCCEDDLAALMLTSGTTGAPRLVMVSHGNLIANTQAIIRSQHLGPDERAMLIMPIAYCFGASVLHTHLYQGGGVVFDSRFIFPDKVLHAINTFGCTTFAGVPAVYRVLLRRSNLRTIPLKHLRRFLQAGGALGSDSVRQMCEIVPTARFMVMYGQTESTVRISCWDANCASEKLGSAGLPLDNLEIRITDSDGRPVRSGQAGEIQVRGPSVCQGYLDDPESTAHNFTDGWLRTHDYGLCDEDGYLWIKGRADGFIKMRGRRVSVSEIEEFVGTIPGVSECAAIPVQDEESGEAVALFIVPETGTVGASETVRCKLPPWWSCASVTSLNELPKTSTGKVARNELRAMG